MHTAKVQVAACAHFTADPAAITHRSSKSSPDRRSNTTKRAVSGPAISLLI
jgi:hypothetical protein